MKTIQTRKKHTQKKTAGIDTARPDELTRVALVAEHSLVRAGLQSILHESGCIKVLEAADSLQAMTGKTAAEQPHVAILDLPLRDEDSEALICSLRHEHPSLPVVVLIPTLDRATLWSAVRAGARGFVLKEAPMHLLVKAVQAVHAGGYWVQRELAAALVGDLQYGMGDSGATQSAVSPDLTNREQQLLLLLAAARRTAEIAAELGITESTVRVHTMRLLRKLHLRNRLEVVAYAIRNGLA